VCGEGNFTVAVVKASTCRLGFHVRPIFQIELGMVDEPLIRAVREFFGFGCVSFPTPRTRAKNESSTVRYTVTAVRDCCALSDFFESSPLLGAKARAFDVWRECLSIIKAGQHTSTEGFQRIVTLRAGINQFRRPSGFRSADLLRSKALPASQGRVLNSWSDAETDLLHRYLDGEMSRPALVAALGRSKASVAARITRARKAQKGR